MVPYLRIRNMVNKECLGIIIRIILKVAIIYNSYCCCLFILLKLRKCPKHLFENVLFNVCLHFEAQTGYSSVQNLMANWKLAYNK